MSSHVHAQAKPAPPSAQAFTSVQSRILQCKCACGQHTVAGGECVECRKKRSRIERKTANQPEPASIPVMIHEVLRSPGQPLDTATRAFMEPRFGHDFSNVRVYTAARAAESARAVNALAYTIGQNIVFGANNYAPGTLKGQELFAHELTHVIQQKGTTASSEVKLANASNHYEAEALHMAETVTSMQSRAGYPVVGPFKNVSSTALQRQSAAEQDQSAVRPQKVWYMLKVPPAVKQDSLTCWAAALSSWMGAMGTHQISFQDIISRYIATACIDTDNALYYSTALEVFAEWGAEFKKYSEPGSITYESLKEMLRQRGHLLLAQTGSPLGHAMVVYGVGIDDKRQPDPNYMSVMDPLSGTYENRAISSLSYPVEIGYLTKRVRPAPCLSRPGEVPAE